MQVVALKLFIWMVKLEVLESYIVGAKNKIVIPVEGVQDQITT